MIKQTLMKAVHSAQMVLKKHSPEILTGLGIAGMLSAIVLAVKATPQALSIIKEKEDEKYYASAHGPIKLTAVETVKAVWKCYIPATITAGMSAGCLVAAGSINVRRQAAMATAYAISETALREYKAKVVETFGEKKEQGVRDAIAKDHVDKNPVGNREVIITGRGTTLCYDTLSDRYFESDINKIQKVENDINRRLRNEMYISLNEFYYELGLKPTGMGDDLGWNIEKGDLELQFSSQLSDDGVPCLVISYNIKPINDYQR